MCNWEDDGLQLQLQLGSVNTGGNAYKKSLTEAQQLVLVIHPMVDVSNTILPAHWALRWNPQWRPFTKEEVTAAVQRRVGEGVFARGCISELSDAH